jgi:hypothetical protein
MSLKKRGLLVQVASKGTGYKNQWILAGALMVFTTFDWPFAQIFDTKNFDFLTLNLSLVKTIF